MLQRYLLLWLAALSVIALFWPNIVPADWQPYDPFESAFQAVNVLIVMIMFCIGTLLPRNQVREVLRNWRAVLLGVLVQYTAMPLLALVFGKLLASSEDQFLGIVMVGCVPGAMASNVLTMNAGGNTSYSVSLTTVATLLSPVAVPFGMLLALRSWHYDEVLLSSSIFSAMTVVLPVLTGFALASWCGERPLVRRITAAVANLCILIVIAAVVGTTREKFVQPAAGLIAALAGINLSGYLAGNSAARLMGLEPPMRRALTIEIGMQNAGLGVALASHLFPNHPELTIAPALYTFGCMLTGTLLAQYWSGRIARAEVAP